MRCGGGGESPELGSFSRPFSEPGLFHVFVKSHALFNLVAQASMVEFKG